MSRRSTRNWHVGQDRAITPDGVTFLKELRNETGFHHRFIGTGSTIPLPWATDLHNPGAVANPIVQYVSDVRGGAISIAKSIDNAAEAAQLTFGDNSCLPLQRGSWWECVANFVVVPGAVNERAVIGLCSDHTNSEDSLDATTFNAWFRLEGNNLSLFVEGDDNVTNTDDQDTGFDVVANTWYHLRIEFYRFAGVVFRWAPYTAGSAPVWANANQSQIAMAALDGTNLVQPIWCVQQDGASGIRALEIQTRNVSFDGWLT